MQGQFGDTKSLIAIQDIKSNTVILNDGSLRQVLMISGINFYLKSEEEQQVILSAYQNFLNSLEFPIQIVIHSRKVNIENYIKLLNEVKTKEESPLLQNQLEEYIEFIKSFIKENAIMSKSFFVVVSYHPVNIIETTTGLINKIQLFSSKEKGASKNLNDDESFKEGLTQINQRTNQIIDGLNTIGLDAVLLNDEQLIELFYNFYNPETVEVGSIKKQSV
jgi:type IV secretory pathway VirB4 component